MKHNDGGNIYTDTENETPHSLKLAAVNLYTDHIQNQKYTHAKKYTENVPFNRFKSKPNK